MVIVLHVMLNLLSHGICQIWSYYKVKLLNVGLLLTCYLHYITAATILLWWLAVGLKLSFSEHLFSVFFRSPILTVGMSDCYIWGGGVRERARRPKRDGNQQLSARIHGYLPDFTLDTWMIKSGSLGLWYGTACKAEIGNHLEGVRIMKSDLFNACTDITSGYFA